MVHRLIYRAKLRITYFAEIATYLTMNVERYRPSGIALMVKPFIILIAKKIAKWHSAKKLRNVHLNVFLTDRNFDHYEKLR